MNSTVTQTLPSSFLWFHKGQASFLSLISEIPTPSFEDATCVTVQSSELCLLPQSWSSDLLLPNSTSTISHYFSCVRKHISETTQAPELPHVISSKMNRMNCFTEKKLCSWWNITSVWEVEMCVLQQYEVWFGAPPDICRAKFPNFTANDTTIRVIFIAAVTYELKC